MNKIISLVFLFSVSVSFSQIKICPPCNFNEIDIIKNKENLLMAEITEYETQVGFEDLDSISKREFVILKIKMKFNSNKLIEYKKFEYSNGENDDEIPKTHTLTYENNRIAKIEYVASPEFAFENKRQIFKYTSNNISRFFYGYNDDMNFKTRKREIKVKTKYDDLIRYEILNNRIVKEVTNSIGISGIMNEKTLKYNSKGDVIFRTHVGVETKTKYNYDFRSNVIRKLITNNYNKGGVIKYQYDISNNLIEEKFYTLRNVLTGKRNYKYDNTGLIEVKNSGNGFGFGMLYFGNSITKYKNDKFGNWIKKITIVDDFPTDMVIRHFTYSQR
ncbi:MAG: hypothetical protein L3J23_04620 [Flavobacteriaceae bacterium]|nr:hypothetical protein [Flavobacteriaceae bacterium]